MYRSKKKYIGNYIYLFWVNCLCIFCVKKNKDLIEKNLLIFMCSFWWKKIIVKNEGKMIFISNGVLCL